MLSKRVQSNLSNSSFIRAMFEEGERLRKIYGAENVYDFSIGNPDYEPPEEVKNSIKKRIQEPNIHKYMNNAGFYEVREKIAKYLSSQSKYDFKGENILMTCGAAGGINVVLNSILNPGEEVILFAPYFAEYLFYIDNYQGVVVKSQTNPDTFFPDLEEFAKNITKNCKAIFLNSPNNPTGVVYSAEILKEIAQIIKRKEQEFGTTIFVISDEPYIKIIYDNCKVPNVIDIFENAIIINSFSKSHALPGDRIGYIAVSPNCVQLNNLIDAMVFSNRVLGFINAPALFQKVIEDTIEISVDMTEYTKRRDYLYDNLLNLGYECIKPQGAFYFFPKSLIPNDVEFAKAALKYNLLIVAGSGFGYPGYFRLAYCMPFERIQKSIKAFEQLAKEFNKK